MSWMRWMRRCLLPWVTHVSCGNCSSWQMLWLNDDIDSTPVRLENKNASVWFVAIFWPFSSNEPNWNSMTLTPRSSIVIHVKNSSPLQRYNRLISFKMDEAEWNLPLSASVDDEFALVVGERIVVDHTFDGVRFEVSQVFVDKSVIFDVGILPLAVSPGRETTRTCAHLSHPEIINSYSFTCFCQHSWRINVRTCSTYLHLWIPELLIR